MGQRRCFDRGAAVMAAAALIRRNRRRFLRLLGPLPALGGLVLSAWLVVHFGASGVGAALRTAGMAGLALVSATHLIITLLLGVAWWVLLYRAAPVKPWTVMWARIMRDAGAEALPFSQLGGYVLGARALVLHGVSSAQAAASTVVDLMAELCSQIAYIGLGAVVLVRIRPETTFGRPLLFGLLAIIPVLIGLIVVQHRGAGLFDRLVVALAGNWLSAIAAGVGAVAVEIRAIYARPVAFCFGMTLHLLGWIVITVESWLALWLMRAPMGFMPVLVIESLLYAIRGLAFAVPNAIGIQEGAYIVLGASFGLPPDIALGLSLLKRGRDLLLGLPALLIWQLVESHRLLSQRNG